MVAEQMAAQRGLVDPTLSEPVSDAPEPWRSLLADLATSLRGSTAEVADLLATNRRLAEAGASSIAESLGHLAAPSTAPAQTAYGDGTTGRSTFHQVL